MPVIRSAPGSGPPTADRTSAGGPLFNQSQALGAPGLDS